MAQESDQKQGSRRLTRLIIFALAVTFAVLLVRPLLSGFQSPSASLPKNRLTSLIEEKALRVLGQQTIPDFTPESGEPEPIVAPVSNLNRQAKDLLDAVKALPQDQYEAAKKQLCKEICGGCQAQKQNEEETNPGKSATE